jgi:predicted component of type VI protein secretion system
MNEARFQEILAAYGADPRRWPKAERAAALAYYSQDAAAKPAVRDAEALDALLAGYAAVPASSDLEIIARISRKVSAAAPQSTRLGSGRPGRLQAFAAQGRNAAAAAGFLAAALTGLFIGFGNGASGVSTADASDELIVSYAMAEG